MILVHIVYYNVYLNVVNHAILTEIFHENRPLQRGKNKIPPWFGPSYFTFDAGLQFLGYIGLMLGVAIFHLADLINMFLNTRIASYQKELNTFKDGSL